MFALPREPAREPVPPLDGSEDKPIYPLDAQSETTGELWRELERATGCSDASTTSPSVS